MKKFCFIVTIILGLSWPAIGAGPDEEILSIAVSYGPSVSNPDPAKGSNGWYLSEAGVTETLFALDFDMQLVPCIGESIRSIDPLVWEIRLKPGVLFHDKTPVTALAVKESLDRLVNEDSKVFNRAMAGLLDIQAVNVVDARTIRIETNSPNAALPYDLTSPATAIVSLQGGGGYVRGTGPFMLESVSPKERLILARFDNYRDGVPGLKKIVLNIIKNPATRMLAFESGQVDLVAEFPETDALRISSRKDVRIVSAATNRLCFFFVRTADGPLADIRVRRAVNYAIDREEIVSSVLGGIGGEAGGSIFPKTLFWTNSALDVHPYDPERAAALLAEAGAMDSDGDGVLELDGAPLVFNMWTYETRASLKPTLELVQAQLARVGIGAVLKVTRKGSPINRAMKRGEVQMNLQMWNAAPQGDPDFFVSRLFTSEAGANYMGYENEELDALAARGKTTFDAAERKNIYDRIQEIIYEESPVIVLFHKSMVSAVRGDLANYRVHPAEKYLVTPELGWKR
jgi:peptide/nickel transport system substrate-binding protein